MANNHGYVSTTSCMCWDVDALNRAGVYAAGNLDNGVFVTITVPVVDTNEMITGYQFPVTPATAESTHVWLVNSPEVGSTLEQQLLADPREFYNKAGDGMSLKYLMPHVDCIEVDKNCFASGALPTTSQNFVTIGANGKLVAATSAPSTGLPYFSVIGYKDIAVGMDSMKVAVLQCEAN